MTWKKMTRYSGWSSSDPGATGAGPVRCWTDRRRKRAASVVSFLSGDCFEGNSAPAHFHEDVFGRRGPLERLGVVVIRRQVVLDRGDEVGHRSEHAATDRLVGELTEPPFDQIEP